MRIGGVSLINLLPSGIINMAEILFPIKGLNKGMPASKQPVNTAYDMNNVRPYKDGRLRGGQRPGLDKWGAGTQVGSAEQPVVAMCIVNTVI